MRRAVAGVRLRSGLPGKHRHRCPAGPMTWIKRVPWGVDGSKDDEGSDGGNTDRQKLTWMTCAVDRLEHAVTDEEFAAGRQRGCYRAVCGHSVMVRAMVSGPGRRCEECG